MFVTVVSVIGGALGTFTGLVPGIHVNTLAALMLASYPLIESAVSSAFPLEYAPILIASCMISAAVVHSFVDFVPSVFLGAPDPDEVMNILPGHRMLHEGKGMVAVRAAAIGSTVGTMTAVVLAVPMQYLMRIGLGEYLESITLVILIAVVMILLIKEKGSKIAWAAFLMMVSGTLGCICMFMVPDITGIVSGGSIHFPLLTGLFGMPAMIISTRNGTMPEQNDDVKYPVDHIPGLKGALTGAFVGWFPGITATSGAVIAGSVTPESGTEKFISFVASIGSASAVFALVTLSVNGSGRTGVVLAVRDVLGGSVGEIGMFMLMLMAVAVATMVGYHMTIISGKVMSRFVGKMDQRKLNITIMMVMVVLVFLMTGVVGMVILIIATILGLIPTAAGVSRVHLSGCLLVPAIVLGVGLA